MLYISNNKYLNNNLKAPNNSIISEYIKFVKELSSKNGEKDYEHIILKKY